MTAINNFLLNLAARKCSKIASENIELKKTFNAMHKDVKSLDSQVNLASFCEIERSEVGNWIFNFYFYLLLIRDQLSLIGREEDLRGSHGFQGERRGNQSSPTEFEGTVEIDCQF